MSPVHADHASQTGNTTTQETVVFEIGEDSDFLRLLDRPRPVSVEKKRSFGERSFSELSNIGSPCRRSSFLGSPRLNYESHPVVSDAWETLRRSVVHFRGQPVGTLAAVDHSVEELNYDQVNF